MDSQNQASPGGGAAGSADLPDEIVRSAAAQAATDLQEVEERAAAIASAEAEAAKSQEAQASDAPVRSRESFAVRQTAMLAASTSLEGVIASAANISAMLTWEPGRLDEVDKFVSAGARSLADLRAHLVVAASAGPIDAADGGQARDPSSELPERYTAALAALREVHRQLGAQIALMENDVTNTPAIIAMERVVEEKGVWASVMCQGLGMVLAELGMVR